MWHVYDSNTSRSLTASYRQGPQATRGDLKACAHEEQNAPSRHGVPRRLAHFTFQLCKLAMHADTHRKLHEVCGNSILVSRVDSAS